MPSRANLLSCTQVSGQLAHAAVPAKAEGSPSAPALAGLEDRQGREAAVGAGIELVAAEP